MDIIIGIADMKVSNNTQSNLITYSLGSCIGIVAYDPVVKAGGILHYMLPESKINGEKAQKNPFMFADTGIPRLFKQTYEYGAKKKRMKIVVTGGAKILDQKNFFNIGKRNHMALRKIFFKNNVLINYESVGGSVNRTVKLNMQTGAVLIKISGQGEVVV